MKKYTQKEVMEIRAFAEKHDLDIEVHYKGEPSNLGSEYTGESLDGIWEIRPVDPPEPRWTVGDWAYSTSKNIIVYIGNPVLGDEPNLHVRHIDGSCAGWNSPNNLRPLADADWVGKIGGKPVRAYETDDGCIYLLFPRGPHYAFYPVNADVAKTICSAFNIPIMPPELHGGVYKRPGE